MIPRVAGHLQVLHRVFSLRWAVYFLHILPCHRLILLLHPCQLRQKSLPRPDGGHIGVGGGVVGHDMPLCRHPSHQFGGGVDIMLHHEKGGGYPVLFQRIQNGGGASVFIPRVKGEIQGLLPRIPHKMGVVPRQLRGGGVADGGLPLCGKGQPPVGGGDGGGGRGQAQPHHPAQHQRHRP